MAASANADILTPDVDTEDAGESWERQEGESDVAFDAFTIYRDMGPGRSLVKVDQMRVEEAAKAGQKRGKNLTTLSDWSAKFGWVRRAADYDTYLDNKSRAESEASRLRDLEAHRTRVRNLSIVQFNTVTRLVLKINRSLDAMEAKPASVGTDGKVIEAQPEVMLDVLDMPRWIRAMAALGQSAAAAEAQTLAVSEILDMMGGDG